MEEFAVYLIVAVSLLMLMLGDLAIHFLAGAVALAPAAATIALLVALTRAEAQP